VPVVFRVPLSDGTKPRVTRASYAEAEQAYHDVMARRPAPLVDRTTTIAQWAERWLATGRAVNGAEWRPNTAARCRAAVRNHIVPLIGDRLVTDFRGRDMGLWRTQLRERGTGPAAMLAAKDTLSAMFSAWVAGGGDLPHGRPLLPGAVAYRPRKDFEIPRT
jgi:hypothetical protein